MGEAFRRSTTVLAVVLLGLVGMESVSAKPKEGKTEPPGHGSAGSHHGSDGNNGHGNDPENFDPSNPGKKGQQNGSKKPDHTSDNDGNNGHGNNAGNVDPSNPGTSNPGGVSEILDGIFGEERHDNHRHQNPPRENNHGNSTGPPIMPQEVADPFETTNQPTSNAGADPILPPSTDDNPTSSTPPYGSIPLIKNDAASVNFLLGELVAEAQKSAIAQGRTPAKTQDLEKAYLDYARRLAKTLSKLSQKQQNIVFYGVE